KQGVLVESREPMTLSTGPGFLVTGYQDVQGTALHRWILVGSTPELTAIVSVQVPVAEKDAHSDASIRAALATFATRANAPAEEQLVALPFKLNDLAGFRVARVLSGTAALLTDGGSDRLDVAEQPVVLIAAASGTPGSQPGDRERFARVILSETPGVKDLRMTRSEPLRISGAQGYEIIAEAKDAKSGAAVVVAQWLRFGSTGHLRMLAMVRKEVWPEVYARLRAVRDGIDLH